MARARQHHRSGWRTALAFALSGLCLLAAYAAFPAPAARADGGLPNLVYVAGAGANADEVVLIDIAAKQVREHIAVGGQPHNIVLSTDGRSAYVTQPARNSLAIVDTQGKRVTATLPVGTEPLGLGI